MSLWSRIANVFRGDRLSREIDEELQSHIAEAIEQGRDPAEARRAFGSALRHREESRDIRLVAWLDSLRADAVFGWRQLMKKKVTSAAAILSLALAIGACTSAFRLIDALLLRPFAGGGPRAAVRSVRPGNRPRRQPGNVRKLGVSDVPPDARRGEGSSRVDRHLLCRADGSDLRVGPGDGESLPAIRFGVDVRLLRTPARPGPAVHRKRRSQAGRASLRRALSRLLDAPLRAGSESDRAHIPDGQRPLRDRRRRRGALHRHRARHGDRHLRSHDDAPRGP